MRYVSSLNEVSEDVLLYNKNKQPGINKNKQKTEINKNKQKRTNKNLKRK